MVIHKLFKKKRRLNFILLCSQVFCKVKIGHWHPLICYYESTYILLVDFDLGYSVGILSDILVDNITRHFAFRYS